MHVHKGRWMHRQCIASHSIFTRETSAGAFGLFLDDISPDETKGRGMPLRPWFQSATDGTEVISGYINFRVAKPDQLS